VEDSPHEYEERYDPNVSDVVRYKHVENDTTYRISVANKGNSPANDVRLTMTYPGVRLVNATAVLENENLTLIKERSNLAVFTLPRLSSGVEISVENNVTGKVNDYDMDPISDFSNVDDQYVYNHGEHSDEPFSIIATYDQGSATYQQPGSSNFVLNVYFNIDVLKFFMPIVLALFLFGIAFRHKKKSISKSASRILKDIETVERHLKNVNSRAILSFSKNGLMGYDRVPIFENYHDLKLIDNFYTALKERESKFSEVYLSNDADYINDIMREQNKKCLSLARSAHSNIDWEKFYKFDLILLIPAVAIGSSFITLVCEGLPFLLFLNLVQYEFNDFYLFLIEAFIARSLGAFFILKLVMYAAQGSTISKKVVSLFSRPLTFFAYCAAIMGFPLVFIFDLFPVSTDLVSSASILIIIVIDIGRMLVLTFVVSRYPWIRKQVAFLKSIK
jgi:hypothetical protein